MEPIFRQANDADIPQIEQLWKTCFPEDDLGYIHRFFDKIPVSTGLVACKGEILSMLFLLPAEVVADGKIYPVRYLYAGCTHPAHRKGGLFGELLRYARSFVAMLGEQGIYLHPASESLVTYYERHGYRPGIGGWLRHGTERSKQAVTIDTDAYWAAREHLLPTNQAYWRLLQPADCFFLDEMLSDGWQAVADTTGCCLISPDGRFAYDCLGDFSAAVCFGAAGDEWQNTAWWIPAEEGNALCTVMVDNNAYTAFLGDI